MNDNSQIPLPEDPTARAELIKVMNRDRAVMKAAESRDDYRRLLNYSLGDTEDFLRITSRDPFYDRSSNVKPYKSGDWL